VSITSFKVPVVSVRYVPKSCRAQYSTSSLGKPAALRALTHCWFTKLAVTCLPFRLEGKTHQDPPLGTTGAAEAQDVHHAVAHGHKAASLPTGTA